MVSNVEWMVNVKMSQGTKMGGHGQWTSIALKFVVDIPVITNLAKDIQDPRSLISEFGIFELILQLTFDLQ